MRGWVKIVFGLSLVLNLLFGGVVVGQFVAHERRDTPMQRYDLGLGPLGLAFLPQDRRAMRDDVERSGANFGEMRNDMRTELTALLDLLSAENLDAAAVKDQLSRMHDGAAKRVEMGEKIMLRRLGVMSLSDRRDYVDRLRQRLPELRDKHRPE